MMINEIGTEHPGEQKQVTCPTNGAIVGFVSLDHVYVDASLSNGYGAGVDNSSGDPDYEHNAANYQDAMGGAGPSGAPRIIRDELRHERALTAGFVMTWHPSAAACSCPCANYYWENKKATGWGNVDWSWNANTPAVDSPADVFAGTEASRTDFSFDLKLKCKNPTGGVDAVLWSSHWTVQLEVFMPRAAAWYRSGSSFPYNQGVVGQFNGLSKIDFPL